MMVFNGISTKSTDAGTCGRFQRRGDTIPAKGVDATDPMKHTDIRKDTEAVRRATPRLIAPALFLFLLIAIFPRHPVSFAGDRSGEAATCESQAGA